MSDVASIEKKSLADSPFMWMLHKTDGEISSMMYSDIRKVPWMSYHKSELTQKTQNQNQSVYYPSLMMHYLHYVHLRASIPEIRVKPEYKDRIRICLPHNLMHNLVQRAEIEYISNANSDVTTGPGFPGKWLDVYSQYFMSPGTGHLETNHSMVGNVPTMTEWTTYIPKSEIGSVQPYYFEESMRSGMPLYACKESPPSFRYTFRLKILDLLRIQILDKARDSDGVWKDLTNTKIRSIVIEGIDGNSAIEHPKLHGYYGTMSDEEYSWKMTKKKTQSIFASTVIEKTIENPIVAGSTATIHLDTDTPVRAIYFIAQHERAVEINNFSNYTTCPEDFMYGLSPIEKVIHKYSGKEIITQDAYDLSKMQPRYHAKSCPLEPGYAMYAKGHHPHLVRPDVGLVYNKTLNGIIGVKLYSSDKSSQWDETEDTEDIDALLDSVLQPSHHSDSKHDNRYRVYAYLLTGYIIEYTPGRPVQVIDGSEDRSLR
jgi:hypothetical protein